MKKLIYIFGFVTIAMAFPALGDELVPMNPSLPPRWNDPISVAQPILVSPQPIGVPAQPFQPVAGQPGMPPVAQPIYQIDRDPASVGQPAESAPNATGPETPSAGSGAEVVP